MRNVKELLEILLNYYENDRLDRIQSAGLCWAILLLYNESIISEIEYNILTNYLYSKKPEWAGAGHWWSKGETALRVEFLTKLIKEYEQE